MKQKMLFFVMIATTLSSGYKGQSPYANPPHNKKIIEKAFQIINEYNKSQKHVDKVVKVVYFHGSDQKPLPNYNARLTRTLDDVSNFYKEEFSRYGVNINGIPFEKKNGNIVFHVVKGDSPALKYNKDSGYKIRNEIYRKTQGQIDLSKDHVLVINGLCYKKGDGTYVFHSPYNGTGSYKNGICHVADCELLDSKFLTDTIQKMVFSEMFVNRKECLVAEFNSWYIGGIVHEMGHFFGLPHDFGNPAELDKSHLSFMGQYGSRHYKDYLWHGDKTSVFSSASVLQLISHQLFTRSGNLADISSNFKLKNLKFERNERGILLSTNFESKARPYGVIALVRPALVSEYFNSSFINVISGTNSVDLELGELTTGKYNLGLLYLFPNGAYCSFNKLMVIDGTGNAKVTDGPTDNTVNMNDLYKKLQTEEQTAEVKTKLEILNGILHPPAPVDPQTCSRNNLFLSDAKWVNATVGWQKVARNYFTCESEAVFFLQLGEKIYKKGLYAHSPSSYVFNLGGKWKSFSAIVGLRDYAHIQGSARFTVIGDGKVLYKSPALRVYQKEIVKVDVSNVKILELQAKGTEGHNHNSWAIWVNPELVR